MSLVEPEKTSPTTAFVCSKSESVLSVIERCLDNGLGTCLIVEDDQRLAGRISLDDIRQALPIQAPRRQRTGCATTSLTTKCCNRWSIPAAV